MDVLWQLIPKVYAGFTEVRTKGYMKFLACIIGLVLALAPGFSAGDVYAAGLDLSQEDDQALEASREALRQRFVDNCTKHQDKSRKGKRITLAGCEINPKKSFVVKYNLISEPTAAFERGRDIPLARHYPKLKNALCSNSEDFADAEIESVTVMYLYQDKLIQSNYLDFNDCFLN